MRDPKEGSAKESTGDFDDGLKFSIPLDYYLASSFVDKFAKTIPLLLIFFLWMKTLVSFQHQMG